MSRSPWAALDLGSRLWWRAVGRPVDVAGEHAWLDAPTSPGSTVADGWLQAAADLHPLVREFHEHTADWRMEVWTGWSPVFAPGGEAIARLFGRRVGQLALPVRPLDVARGADGSLWLHSRRGRFGEDGAYVVVEVGGRTHAARVPLHETFQVFVDDEGVLRTDHALDLWSMRVVRLHYRLERRPAAATGAAA